MVANEKSQSRKTGAKVEVFDREDSQMMKLNSYAGIIADLKETKGAPSGDMT